MKWAVLTLLLLQPAWSAPKVLVIGDSLSEEYSFEIPFSAPDDDPLDANTENWIELLDTHRATAINFGSYASSLASYPDLRNGGFSYNWSVPGAETELWHDVVNSTLFDHPGYLTSRFEIEDQLDEVDVVVILLGGNDVRSIYGSLYNNSPTSNWITDITDDLKDVIDFIQSNNSSLPIVLCTIPDVGATPDKQAAHPDAAARSVAAGHMAILNTEVTNLAAAEGAHLANIAQLTTEISADSHYFIGATQMIKGSHPNNEPLYLFCKDGFHPATGAQAIIANTILESINTATSSAIPLLEPREIISNLLTLDPDQPYIDWAASYFASTPPMTEDFDNDGLNNLAEYALGTLPHEANSLFSLTQFTQSTQDYLSLTFPYSEEGERLVEVVSKQSSNLVDWDPVPNTLTPSNDKEIVTPINDKQFFRLEFQLRP